jgi:hypothetical protein
MKKYFLQDGSSTIGPFDLEDLKEKKITRDTLVWCEGMEDWKKATEVNELGGILTAVPPPIKMAFTIPPIPKATKVEENVIILGLSKKMFYTVSGILAVLIISTFILNTFQENSRDALDQKNKTTERENEQFTVQQKEIEEQKTIIAAQERLEKERIAKEKKQSLLNKKKELEKLFIEYTEKLEVANKQLIDASGFKLLRTTSERNEEISIIQNDIDYYRDEITKLVNQIKALHSELEAINSLPAK